MEIGALIKAALLDIYSYHEIPAPMSGIMKLRSIRVEISLRQTGFI